ncbi:MAG: hypothetical protein FWH17_01395 [Oscillospiraceae bacterium]|nr:hypothetical protein [Oscillospiraceae bacterium]
MSIKGIDTQIMVQRTTDMARDTSAILKNPESAQQQLANQTKISSALDQSRVLATNESDMQGIRTDEDGSGSGAAGGGASGGGEDGFDDENVPPELAVAPADHDPLVDFYV